MDINQTITDKIINILARGTVKTGAYWRTNCGAIYRFQNQREQVQYWDRMNKLTKQYTTV